ncbi:MULTISPECIES: hypothetical protein [Nocardioides]|uniref:Uncharacterized protein n=1 Tax=Nocardioides vastitatis TaxID=2568655 RepID=A0ABW0ZRP2_9ACTN|nr:hypothetical protein [Nocardioides sp.]THI96739.1 hypothetical protein E7Z54_15835 [Nocardioides sp.]
MTDSPEHDPPLTPSQEAAVRRALAEAGGPEPLPDDVADRLDKVIAGLAAERAGSATVVAESMHPESRGVIVPLDPAARRRRARVRVLLAGAAAVVAVAAGAGILRDSDTADMSTAGDSGLARSDDAAEKGETLNGSRGEAAEEPTAATPEDQRGAEGPEGYEGTAPERLLTDEPLRKVRANRLRADLVAIQHASLPHPATADYSRTTLTAPASFMCEDADYGRGYLVGVEYDARPALVAFRKPVGSTQVAEVLVCGTGDVLHSTTLRALD